LFAAGAVDADDTAGADADADAAAVEVFAIELQLLFNSRFSGLRFGLTDGDMASCCRVESDNFLLRFLSLSAKSLMMIFCFWTKSKSLSFCSIAAANARAKSPS